MEINARYLWVGLVTFIAILATVWYVLWISSSKDGATQSLYDIYFSQNIAGLQEGSSVLLRGVPVGRVLNIRFDPKHPEQVRVRIQVTNTAPIRQDSTATVEPQGITGLANIQITGGSPQSPYLRPLDAENIPVITAGASRVEEILSAVPNILVTTTNILKKVESLINENNIQKLDNIIDNADKAMAGISEQREAINKLMVESIRAVKEFKRTNENLSLYITKELVPLTSNINTLVGEFPTVIENVNERIDDIAAITTDTQKTIMQARIFLMNFDKLVQQFQSNPRQFLFGNPYSDYATE